MDKTEKKVKTIGVKFIFGWIFGLLFLYTGAMELFTRPSGVTTILMALIIFPPSMQFVTNKTGIKLSAVLKIVIILILLGIGTGLNLSAKKSGTSFDTQTSVKVGQPTTIPTPTPIVLNMSEFFDKFSKNKVAVESSYVAKRLQFTGFIENISSDWNEYYLKLAPTNDQYYYGTTVRCYFVNKEALINFSKGQSITVAGTFQETDYESWVELHDCSAVK